MALTPFDVEHKTFRTALRGYAEEEVDEFLDEIVASLREHEQKLRDALETAGVLESELTASRETEGAIKRTFIAAQRTADQIIDEARQEASKVVAEARAEAVQHEAERSAERGEAKAELEAMRESVGKLKEELRKFASSTFDEVDDMESAIEEASSTYGFDEDEVPTFEVPALVGEAEDDFDYESFGDEASDDDEAVETEIFDATDSGIGEPTAAESDEDDRDVDVDLGSLEDEDGHAYLRRPRPRRPWERDI